MESSSYKNPFKLEKLKIEVYGDNKRVGMPQDTFEVMFNPNSYSLNYKNVYAKYQGINTTGRVARYSLSKPEELSLQLILDDTVPESILPSAVSHTNNTKDIYDRVQHFLDLTNYMDGERHEPKCLKIKWGKLIFDCRLQSVNISYTLFKRDGTPLRANLDTVFIQDWNAAKRNKIDDKQSADLTRIRMNKSSETLPFKAEEMYGDPMYYIKIAQANRLNNFRKLVAGDALYYPPLI